MTKKKKISSKLEDFLAERGLLEAHEEFEAALNGQVLSPSPIGAAERKRRKDEVDFARGSCRLEGIILSDEAEVLNKLYINGEITSDEHLKQGLALCDDS